MYPPASLEDTTTSRLASMEFRFRRDGEVGSTEIDCRYPFPEFLVQTVVLSVLLMLSGLLIVLRAPGDHRSLGVALTFFFEAIYGLTVFPSGVDRVITDRRLHAVESGVPSTNADRVRRWL